MNKKLMYKFYDEINSVDIKDLNFSENLIICGIRIWFNFDNKNLDPLPRLRNVFSCNKVEEITIPFNKIMKLTASYCFSQNGKFESCCRILSFGELSFLNAIAYIQYREDQEGHNLISFWLPKFVLLDAFKQCTKIASGLEKAGYFLPVRHFSKYRTKEFFKPTLH
tara:strand:+ start:1010 stop:1507 length:498 start_codon:yes stop_codon:yes gene_type:complete